MWSVHTHCSCSLLDCLRLNTAEKKVCCPFDSVGLRDSTPQFSKFTDGGLSVSFR